MIGFKQLLFNRLNVKIMALNKPEIDRLTKLADEAKVPYKISESGKSVIINPGTTPVKHTDYGNAKKAITGK